MGIAGGPEKCARLKELGIDAVIDYKALAKGKDGDVEFQAILAALKDACPQGVDIYFDNVGGSTTDALFNLINVRARVIICGAISQYNSGLGMTGVGGVAGYVCVCWGVEFSALDDLYWFADSLLTCTHVVLWSRRDCCWTSFPAPSHLHASDHSGRPCPRLHAPHARDAADYGCVLGV